MPSAGRPSSLDIAEKQCKRFRRMGCRPSEVVYEVQISETHGRQTKSIRSFGASSYRLLASFARPRVVASPASLEGRACYASTDPDIEQDCVFILMAVWGGRRFFVRMGSRNDRAHSRTLSAFRLIGGLIFLASSITLALVKGSPQARAASGCAGFFILNSARTSRSSAEQL